MTETKENVSWLLTTIVLAHAISHCNTSLHIRYTSLLITELPCPCLFKSGTWTGESSVFCLVPECVCICDV